MAQNDSSDVVKKWQDGVVLSFAWYQFADRHALQKFRGSETREALRAEQMLMMADLWAGLRNGELQAIGKCVAPKISDGPMLIPAHTFELEPPRSIEEDDAIEISGWRYEGVKVVRIREANPIFQSVDQIDFNDSITIEAVDWDLGNFLSVPFSKNDINQDLNAGLPHNIKVDPPAHVEINFLDTTTSPERRGGVRRNTYMYSIVILQELYQIESNRHLSAENLYRTFSLEFERRFPIGDYCCPAPSVRTLRDQIKRYRQELAETGSD